MPRLSPSCICFSNDGLDSATTVAEQLVPAMEPGRGDGDLARATSRVTQPEGGGPVPLCHPLWLLLLEPLGVQAGNAKKYNGNF